MAKTQLQRGDKLRRDLNVFYPKLAAIKDELKTLLNEAQNAPPHGEADGSLSETQYSQLCGIHDALQEFLIVQLFNKRG